MKKLVFIAFALLSSLVMVNCGKSSDSKDPAPASVSDGSTTFAQMQVLLNANCATSGCHNGTQAPNYSTISETAMRADTKAAGRVAAGTMPPTGPLSAADKEKFKNFY